MYQVVCNNKLEYKCTIKPLDPRLLYVGPNQAKGHLSRFIQLPVYTMYTMSSCMCGYRTPACTIQCWAASNAQYAVLGSFQCVLLSFSCSIHHICTILPPYLSKLYSIAIYLNHRTNNFFYTLKYHNFLSISNWDKTKTVGKLKISSIV